MIETFTVDPRIKVRFPKNLLLLPRVPQIQTFDEDGAKLFREEMSIAHRSGQAIIPVIIDSYGGDPYSLLSMVDTIRSSKVPVATIIQGKAMSCGAVLFSCGTDGYRFIAPNATIMVHDVNAGGDEISKKTEEFRADAKETHRLNKKLYSILDKNCGQPPGTFWGLVHDRGRVDWYIAPREAVRLNLANHIKVPTFRTTVTVTNELEF